MKKNDINVQSFFKKLTEEIDESMNKKVVFSIDDEDVDSLFSRYFEGDVDYIYDGPDAYYVLSQSDLDAFIDFIESRGSNADAIQIQQYMAEEGGVTGGGEAYLPAMDVPKKKQNPFTESSELYESILSGYEQIKGFRAGHTPDTGGFQYRDLWGLNEDKVIGKTKSGKDIYLDFNNPAHKDFTAADHADASQALLTVKSKPGMQSKNTVTPARKKAAKQHFDASKAKQKELSENYARFRNETKTRTKPEQFHEAVKSVKRRVQEINKLYEYMERLKMELSESSDGLKYKKYTENAIIKIKEAVKALHIKTKKLK
jgi:hypothetical protein